MVHTLIPLTKANVPSDVQGNAAAAIGNLATKVADVTHFLSEWDHICAYLERFLEPVPASSSHGTHYHEQDDAAATFQHIAVWTLLQFCEKGEPLRVRLLQRPHLIRLVQNLESVNQDEEVQMLTARVLTQLGVDLAANKQQQLSQEQ